MFRYVYGDVRELLKKSNKKNLYKNNQAKNSRADYKLKVNLETNKVEKQRKIKQQSYKLNGQCKRKK